MNWCIFVAQSVIVKKILITSDINIIDKNIVIQGVYIAYNVTYIFIDCYKIW